MNIVSNDIKQEFNDIKSMSLDSTVYYIINEHRSLLSEQWYVKMRDWIVKYTGARYAIKTYERSRLLMYNNALARTLLGTNERMQVADIFIDPSVQQKIIDGEKIAAKQADEIVSNIRKLKSAHVPLLEFIEKNWEAILLANPDLTGKELELIWATIKKFQTADKAFLKDIAKQERLLNFLEKYKAIPELKPVIDDLHRLHIGPLPADLIDEFLNPNLLKGSNKTKYMDEVPTNKKELVQVQNKNNPLGIKLKGDPKIIKLFDEELQIMNAKGKWVDVNKSMLIKDFQEQLLLLDQGLISPTKLQKWLNDNFSKYRRKSAPKTVQGKYTGRGDWSGLIKSDYDYYDVTLAHEIAEILNKKGMLPNSPTTWYSKQDKVYKTVVSPARVQSKPIADLPSLQKMKQNNPNNTRLVKPGFEGAPELTKYLRRYELGEVPPEELVKWVNNIPAGDDVKLAVIKKLEASGDIKIQGKMPTKMTQTGPASFEWMGPKISVTKRNADPNVIILDNIVEPRVLVLGETKGIVVTADSQSKIAIKKSVNELEGKLPKGNTKFDASKINIEKMSTQTTDGFTVIEVKLENGNTVLMFKNNSGVNKDKWFVTPGIGFYKKYPKGTLNQPMQKWSVKDKWFVQNSKSKKVTTGGNDYMTELAKQLESGNISTGKPESILPDFIPTRSSTAPELKYTPDYNPAPIYKKSSGTY